MSPATPPGAPASALETLERFDRPGPRYTSYPTAVEFHDGVDDAVYRRHLQAADAQADEPLALYVHLPFCEERCRFCACHVVATRHREIAEPYLDGLARELDLLAAALPRRRRLAQLHWGGGTPTYLAPAQLERLFHAVVGRFPLSAGAEVAIEVDPRVTSPEHVETLARLGFNRLSLGVQDIDPRVQEAIGRHQSWGQTSDLVEQARACGFTEGINVDLVYGLPRQTLDSFRRGLDRVVELRPDRLAVYSFAFVPWLKGNQRAIDDAELPAARDKLRLYLAARDAFLDAGYEAIGMDHFALPDDELAVAAREGRLARNFMGYTVRPASANLGLGISAIADLEGGYFQNAKKLSVYYRRLAAGRLPVERGVEATGEDRLRRWVITQIMCNFRVDKAEVAERFGVEFDSHFAAAREALGELAAVGLVTDGPGELEVEGAGRLLVRNAAMAFDAYRGEPAERPDLLEDGVTARVVVVGAGIAGLATAIGVRDRAAAAGVDLELAVLESAPRAGGNIRTERRAGYTIERGPNGWLDSVPATGALVRRLGLEGELVKADDSAAVRFLYRGGRLHQLPSGPASFLASRVLSLPGRLRVLLEPFARRRPEGVDESVFDFAARRIGREAASVLVDAMVSGVFAGDVHRLSLASAFPKMHSMESEHGGLVKAMLARRRRAAGEGRRGGPAGPGGTLTSLRGGLDGLISSLVEELGGAVQLGRRVRRIERSDEARGGWRVVTAHGLPLVADAVVLATPAPRTALMLGRLAPDAAEAMAEIPSAGLAVVALGLQAEAMGGAPRGFGFLVPRSEGVRLLGCLWDSSIFPHRAPGGRVLLRAMIGGAHDPQAVQLPAEELVSIVRRELARTMGLTAEPELTRVYRHSLGISQYTVGHRARMERIRDELGRHSGLHLVGSSITGVAINSCVEAAAELADRIAGELFGATGS